MVLEDLVCIVFLGFLCVFVFVQVVYYYGLVVFGRVVQDGYVIGVEYQVGYVVCVVYLFFGQLYVGVYGGVEVVGFGVDVLEV